LELSLRGERLHLWRGERHVLRGLDLELRSGEALQICGANGAGKTSLLRTLCGLAHPEEGRVLWNGADVRRDLRSFHTALAYIGHESPLKADLSAGENLRCWAGIRRRFSGADVDSALLGWEVYARKDNFYKETGIALAAGSSKQTALVDKPAGDAPAALPPLYYALEAFLSNCAEVTSAVEDFKTMFNPADKASLATTLHSFTLSKPYATYQDGYAATVLALKANEAVNGNKRIELNKEWFELA